MSNGTVPPPLNDDSSSGKGCFFYGCIISLVLLVVIIGLGCFGVWKVIDIAKGYTGDAPVELPQYELQADECEKLELRVDTFKSDGGTLSLSADDLNAYVACNEDMSAMRDKVWMNVVDDQLVLDGSFPLDVIPGFKGRYFNGSITLDIFMRDGILHAYAKDVDIEGHVVPDSFIEGLGGQNLAKDLHSDSNVGPLLKELETIEVKDGQLILVK